MAGRPKRKAIITELMKRALAEIEREEGEAEPTIVDYAEIWVGSGRTVKALADDVGRAIGTTVLREQLSRILHEAEGAEDRIARARTRGATGLVEEALELADRPAETPMELGSQAKAIDMRKWLAQRFDRAGFGDQKQTNVAISIGGLHLDALRSRARATATMAAAELPALPGGDVTIDVDTEVL